MAAEGQRGLERPRAEARGREQGRPAVDPVRDELWSGEEEHPSDLVVRVRQPQDASLEEGGLAPRGGDMGRFGEIWGDLGRRSLEEGGLAPRRDGAPR